MFFRRPNEIDRFKYLDLIIQEDGEMERHA